MAHSSTGGRSVNVAADPQALAEFAAVSSLVAAALGSRHDDLANQRAGLVGRAVVAPPDLALPALAEVAQRSRASGADVARVGDAVVAADRWSWGPGFAGSVARAPTAGWSTSDVDRMVALGELRRRLAAGRMAGGTRYREEAAAQLQEVEGEIAALAELMDRNGWAAVADAEAGFDRDHWDPTRGMAYNDANIRAVYTFYGRLYLDDPSLQWAGLAALVGRQFYAGGQDLHAGHSLLTHGDRMNHIERLLGLPQAPRVVHQAAGLMTGITPLPAETQLDDKLEGLETGLLSMVLPIFDDMAWMHVAHLYGGTGAVVSALDGRQSGDDRILAAAWTRIGSGDPGLIDFGNKALAYREQDDIIGPTWDAIREASPWLTTMLTAMVENPVPDGRPYRDVFTKTIELPPDIVLHSPAIPNFQFEVTVPDGNISVFEDRWRYFDQEVEPSFRRMLDERPEELRAILHAPLDPYVNDLRLHTLPYRGDPADHDG